MPVRVAIHSSEVSTRLSRSEFGSTWLTKQNAETVLCGSRDMEVFSGTLVKHLVSKQVNATQWSVVLVGQQ